MIEIAGSTRKALRVLEAHGLIVPTRVNGSLRYSQACLRRFWLIGLLRDVGLSLGQIGELLALSDQASLGGEAASSLVTAIGYITRRVDAAKRDLEIAREALVTAETTLSSHCAGCTRPTTSCADCAKAGKLDIVSKLLLVRKVKPHAAVAGNGHGDGSGDAADDLEDDAEDLDEDDDGDAAAAAEDC